MYSCNRSGASGRPAKPAKPPESCRMTRCLEPAEKISKKACINNNAHPHTFRHTFATHMLNNGCPLKSVQEYLGHSSLASTEVYTHITNDYIKEEYLKNIPRK